MRQLAVAHERIDIKAPVASVCEALGLVPSYVAHIAIVPGQTTVTLYKGTDGRCQGAKYISPDTNRPALETLTFETWS